MMHTFLYMEKKNNVHLTFSIGLLLLLQFYYSAKNMQLAINSF